MSDKLDLTYDEAQEILDRLYPGTRAVIRECPSHKMPILELDTLYFDGCCHKRALTLRQIMADVERELAGDPALRQRVDQQIRQHLERQYSGRAFELLRDFHCQIAGWPAGQQMLRPFTEAIGALLRAVDRRVTAVPQARDVA